MPIEILLEKRPDGSFIPVTPEGVEDAKKFKVGTGVTATITKKQNYQFHKKLFALLGFLFENWDAESQLERLPHWALRFSRWLDNRYEAKPENSKGVEGIKKLIEDFCHEENEYRKVHAVKSFESFRGEVTILAGYYEQTFTLNGEAFKLVPQSLSYDKMSPEEREIYYNQVCDVGLEKILSNYTMEDLEHGVDYRMNNMMEFIG